MVQVVRKEQTGQDLTFKEAKHFLEEGNFDAVDLEKKAEREPFSYYLQPYETDFYEARQYLKEGRKLSDKTIDYFIDKGVVTQAKKKSGDIFEPVIVFKSLDRQNDVVGASLQGIRKNNDLYTRGRLKQIMRASDGMTGMHVDIGEPKRLVFAEAPIDLMSYYELHKDSLQDVRLVAMDGLKESTVSRHVGDLLFEMGFAEAPIDLMSYYELHKDSLQDVRLVAMDGLKESTVSRHVGDLLFEMGVLKQKVEAKNYPTFLAHTSQVTNFLRDEKYHDLITLAVDNDQAGKTFVDRLESKKINLVMDLPPLSEGADKIDWNDYLKREKEKALNRSQELSNNIGGELFNRNSGYLEGKPSEGADKIDWNDYLKREKEKALNRSQELSNNIGGELFNRNSGYLEGKPSRTAPQPEELIQTQPDFPTNVHLHFNIERSIKSSHSPRMRPIIDRDVRYLNRYAEDIQNSARWYKNEIANSKVTYFYQDQEDVKMLQVNFEKRHWMHLTGMAPVYAEHVISLSETFIDDIASGRGTYPNLTISNDFKDKIKLLPLLPEIFETDSFVFDDLTSVEKMGRLDVQKAIRSDDKDIMLAFRTDEESSFPATLLKPNTTLNIELDSLNQEKVILGVFLEKDNILKTLSVNNNFVKDDGKQMFEAVKQLQNREHGEIKMSNNEEYNEAISIAEAQKEEHERDSDGDGIPDEVERNLGTNPYSADSDGDGKSDHEEVSFGSNPLQAEQSQPESKIPSEVSKTVSEMIQEKDSKGLSQLLKEGVKDYFKSDVYKEYLTALSKFHHYSPRNIQLILAQNPNASYVASFKKWKEDFDRSVNKGEKSMRIFAFHHYSPRNIQLILAQNPNASYVASFKKWKEDFDRSVNKGEKSMRIFAPVTVKQKDPETGKVLLDKEGKEKTKTFFKLVPVFDVSQTDGKELAKPPVTVKQKDPETGKVLLDKEGKEKTKTFFKLVPVFDVSQTDGKELAKPIYDLEGTYQDYGNLYKSAKKVSEANGIAVEFADDLNGAHGTYSRQTNSISILKGMSEQQTLKTLFHEMAHSELHTLDKMIEQPLSRSTKELQAESVAFVVASHYGMDTSEYSFGYLATWSQDKEGLTDLEGQIKIVQKEADNLITKIDSVLEKYQSKEITKDGFQEKLARIKNKETKKVVKIEEKEQAKETSKKESKSDNEMSL